MIFYEKAKYSFAILRNSKILANFGFKNFRLTCIITPAIQVLRMIEIKFKLILKSEVSRFNIKTNIENEIFDSKLHFKCSHVS